MNLELDVLLASIYYLMTRYARRPDRRVAQAIAEHLRMLEERGDCDSAVLRSAGRRLALQWTEHLDCGCACSDVTVAVPCPHVKLH